MTNSVAICRLGAFLNFFFLIFCAQITLGRTLPLYTDKFAMDKFVSILVIIG